jgi:hypothetical protein
MSYRVTFRDRTTALLENSKGEQLKKYLLSNRPPVNIEINGELYRASEIISVKKAVATEDNIPVADWNTLRLPTGKKCHGQYSVQNEINKIAKNTYGKVHWSKLIHDKKWRESIYQELLKTPDKWCDYKKGTCYCE